MTTMIKEIRVRPIDSDPKEKRFAVTGEIASTFRGNRIIFATSEDQNQPVVIKIPIDRQGARREWIGLRKTSEARIPVPSPIMLGLTDSNFTCVVSERVEGRPLFLYSDDEARMFLGKTTKMMHSEVRILDSGEGQNELVDFSQYKEQIYTWGINQYKAGIDWPLTQYLFKTLSDPMSSYCDSIAPVFNHGDIHDGQVIVSPKNDITLIDFESWSADRPLNDLGFYLFHCLRSNREFEAFKSFMDGYSGDYSLNEKDIESLVFYLLFVSTTAVFKFITLNTDYLETARENHMKVLTFIQNETLWKSL